MSTLAEKSQALQALRIEERELLTAQEAELDAARDKSAHVAVDADIAAAKARIAKMKGGTAPAVVPPVVATSPVVPAPTSADKPADVASRDGGK
jgi:hypothetical protein